MNQADATQASPGSVRRGPSLIVVMAVLLLLGTLKIKDTTLPESSLPRMNLLESKAQKAAKSFLDKAWGLDATRGWTARLMYRAFQKVEGDVNPAPELYPKNEIDYLLRQSPQDYIRLAKRYKLGSLGLVRLKPISRDSKEAVDLYLSGNYEVYGMILHNWPTTSDSLDQAAFTAMALDQLKLIPGWDSQLFQTPQPSLDAQGNWHLDLRDLNPPKGLECGYELVAKGAQLLKMMPYVKLAPSLTAAISTQAAGWKTAQRIATVFIILFFASGLVGMFWMKFRSSSSIILLLAIILNMTFEGGDILTVKLRQIFGDMGVMPFVGGAVFVLGMLLIYYSHPHLAKKALPASKPGLGGYTPYLVLILIMVVQAMGNDGLMAIQRYAYANGTRWVMMNWLGVYLGFPALCLGAALYYRYLSVRMASLRHGTWLSILLALALSASYLLIVNPQIYSPALLINSLFYLAAMTLGLFFFRYETDGKTNLLYSLVMLSMVVRTMPSVVGITQEQIWFRLLKLLVFLGMALLFDLFYRQSPQLWAESRRAAKEDKKP